MTTQKHTPGRLHRNIRPISRYPVLFTGRNSHVAIVKTMDIPEAEAEANADRLIMCWNSHDDLVKALEYISRACEPGIDQSDDDLEQIIANVRNIARAALAKAGAA